MTAPSPNAALVKNDFGDWLSPILVKELRQGVRTRIFVSTFILLQALLLLNVSLSLLVASAQEDTAAGTTFFWLTVGLPVLLVLPLNALGSVGHEIKTNTLELTFLTRLTAFRIIAGKWFAVLVQALLLVCAVLPYVVLRYFIGGVNLSNELATLGKILAASALLGAAATGISGYPVRVVRFFSIGFCLVALCTGVSSLSYLFDGGSVLGPGLGVAETLGVSGCGLILLLAMLEVGAARIAPPAENHSAALRLLAYGALALAAVVHLFAPASAVVTLLAFTIALTVCTGAICEKPRHILSLFRPFAARGWPGRAAGRFLYPGWPSGVLFLLTIFAGFGALLWRQKLFVETGNVVQFVAFAGALLLPLALIRGLLPKARQPVTIFLGFQFFCVLVTTFCGVCDGVLKTGFKDFSAIFPLCTLLLSLGDGETATAGRMPLVGFTTLASLVVVLALARREMQAVRRGETESLQIAAPPSHAPLA